MELTAGVVEQATLLRADHHLRTPDALQAGGPDVAEQGGNRVASLNRRTPPMELVQEQVAPSQQGSQATTQA